MQPHVTGTDQSITASLVLTQALDMLPYVLNMACIPPNAMEIKLTACTPLNLCITTTMKNNNKILLNNNKNAYQKRQFNAP